MISLRYPEKQDYQGMRGFCVTSPLRTILDIIVERCIENRFIKQVIFELFKRGLLVNDDIRKIGRINTSFEIFKKLFDFF